MYFKENESEDLIGEKEVSDKAKAQILKALRAKLDEFERVREELETQIESTLNQKRKKKQLKKYIHRKEKEIEKITDIVDNIYLTLKSWTEGQTVTMSISPSKRRDPFSPLRRE